MLLLLNSSTKRVALPQAEAEMQDVAGTPLEQTASGIIGEPLALSDLGSEAFGSLDYDSDGDDGDASQGFDLEFADDQEHGVDIFHSYVEGQGYAEKNDASFSPAVWNSDDMVRLSHNCYMYALNDLSPRSGQLCKRTHAAAESAQKLPKKELRRVCRSFFHKPGYYFQNFVQGRAETDVWTRKETTCKLMVPMLAADSPAIVWHNQKNMSLTEDDACPTSHYMAALFIQPRAGFHFYRRDHACSDDKEKLCWSHKPGILEATTKDASGSEIGTSVLKANRNYGQLNYSEHCAFFCVPQNSQARTHSDSRRAPRSKA